MVARNRGHSDTGFPIPHIGSDLKVWDRGKGAFGFSCLSKFSPIWHNSILPELAKLEGFGSWLTMGISTIDQIQKNGDLKPFDQLQAESGQPSGALFQYLRLKHAYMTQAKTFDLTVHNNHVLDRKLNA